MKSINYTMTKLFVQAGVRGMNAAYAYVISKRAFPLGGATKQQLVQRLIQQRVSESQAYTLVNLLFAAEVIGTPLAYYKDAKRQKNSGAAALDTRRISQISFYKIMERLDVIPMLELPITDADLVSPKHFRDVLIDMVRTGINRDSDGGSTNALISDTKLTSLSVGQLRRHERRMGYEVRTNVCVVDPQYRLPQNERKRQRGASNILQIRNTRFSPRPGHYADMAHIQLHGDNAGDTLTLATERGQQIRRLAFEPVKELLENPLVVAALQRITVFLDLRIGERVNEKTGELIGIFYRVAGGDMLVRLVRDILANGRDCVFALPAFPRHLAF